MSLSGSRSRLGGVTRELAARWRETREHWTDAKRDEFERRFLGELWPNVDRSIAAMEELDQLLAKVKRDCE